MLSPVEFWPLRVIHENRPSLSLPWSVIRFVIPPTHAVNTPPGRYPCLGLMLDAAVMLLLPNLYAIAAVTAALKSLVQLQLVSAHPYMSMCNVFIACITSLAGLVPRSIPLMFWNPNLIQCGGVGCDMSSPNASYNDSSADAGYLYAFGN